MKSGRSVRLHLVALAVAGVATYGVYATKESAPAFGSVVIDASIEKLTKLVFDTGGRKVEVVRRQAADGWFLTVTEQKADPSRAEKDHYRANEEFEKALEKLVPMRAERVLPSTDVPKQSSYGFDGKRRLQLDLGDHAVSLIVGDETYGGLTNYIFQEPRGPTFLLSSTALRALTVTGTRYLERRIVSAAEKDVDRIVVTAPDMRRTLLHSSGDKGGAGGDVWADQTAPDQPNELYKNWMAKIFRLQVAEYLPEGSTLLPVELFKLEYSSNGKPTDRVELASLKTPEGKTDYVARSHFTGGWVKLVRATAEEVVADLPSITGNAPHTATE